jgi:transposase-like protein
MTKEERRAHWRTIIEEQAASGMKITAFCREKQINRHQFHAWRRRLRDQQPCTGFLELVPGRVFETRSGISVHPGNKIIIEVERGFDPFTLRAVVETLRSLSPCSV